MNIVDMTDVEYFGHAALSHSDAKLILDTPARYRWIKDHPRPYTPHFEFGHVVHTLVIGVGPDIYVVEAADWRTAAARESRDSALARGFSPILAPEFDEAKACADAVRLHPLAARLLDHLDHVEQAGIWLDGDIERKAKLDGVCGRFGIDLKTTVDASTDHFGRAAGKYAYATQQAWYEDALQACFDIPDPEFLFVVVEKHPPYLVNIIKLDRYDIELGARRNRAAIDLYRQCRDTDTWPAYGDGINTAQLPRWWEIEQEAM